MSSDSRSTAAKSPKRLLTASNRTSGCAPDRVHGCNACLPPRMPKPARRIGSVNTSHARAVDVGDAARQPDRSQPLARSRLGGAIRLRASARRTACAAPGRNSRRAARSGAAGQDRDDAVEQRLGRDRLEQVLVRRRARAASTTRQRSPWPVSMMIGTSGIGNSPGERTMRTNCGAVDHAAFPNRR